MNSNLSVVFVFVICGVGICQYAGAGVTDSHCARCDASELGELKNLLSNQIDGVPFENTEGVSGKVVVVRGGKIVPIGIASLVLTGAQITTDQHVVFRGTEEKKKGVVETTITDVLRNTYFARGSDDGKVYFEPLYYQGLRNLIEIELDSLRVVCRYSKGNASTVGCDGVEFKLRESALHKFKDPRMYAYLLGRPGNHDELHSSKSHFFVVGIGMRYVFHENCLDIGNQHPSMFPLLSDNIAFHGCPSWENTSGASIQKVSKSKRRYLKGIHKAGEGTIRANGEWVGIPKTAVLVDEQRIYLMEQIFFEYLDENGIHPNDRSTWPKSAFDTD